MWGQGSNDTDKCLTDRCPAGRWGYLDHGVRYLSSPEQKRYTMISGFTRLMLKSLV